MKAADALRMDVAATDGAARAGAIHTARGTFDTPCFMPVGTRGTVKALDTGDLRTLGASVVLANTYHLMLRPGADVVAALGGLHRFSGWDGHLLTDSGGFQVHSLAPVVDDDGVEFRSVYDGTTVRLTPESAVEIQGLLGADIQMVLDVCVSLPADPSALRVAVDRTADWAARARRHHGRIEDRPEHQALFGIVQGGTDEELRRQSARRTVALGFDGYGIGGLSVGEPRPQLLASLAAAIGELPADRPRYLMGVGDPVGLVEAVALGVDLFDCVAPTRAGRHGTVFTSEGRLSLRNARFTRDDGALDPACTCVTCTGWSRGFLRHLVVTGEPTAWRLLSIHNLAFTLDLVASARRAVLAGPGSLAALQAATRARWEA